MQATTRCKHLPFSISPFSFYSTLSFLVKSVGDDLRRGTSPQDLLHAFTIIAGDREFTSPRSTLIGLDV